MSKIKAALIIVGAGLVTLIGSSTLPIAIDENTALTKVGTERYTFYAFDRNNNGCIDKITRRHGVHRYTVKPGEKDFDAFMNYFSEYKADNPKNR